MKRHKAGTMRYISRAISYADDKILQYRSAGNLQRISEWQDFRGKLWYMWLELHTNETDDFFARSAAITDVLPLAAQDDLWLPKLNPAIPVIRLGERRKSRTARTLLVRANMKVGERLLDDLPELRNIGVVSTGTDNVDFAATAARGIRVFAADGANADAVTDFTVLSLLYLWKFHPELKEAGAGVLGAGNVGSRLIRLLKAGGIPVRVSDPFVSGYGYDPGAFRMPVLCVHVSLHDGPSHPTRDFLHDQNFQGARPFIIQMARGELWDEDTYRTFLDSGRIWLQDVYPGEPFVNREVLRARINLPHIAGYSANGRMGGTIKVLRRLFPGMIIPDPVPSGRLAFGSVRHALLKQPADFRNLRNAYPPRMEATQLSVAARLSFRRHFNMPEEFWKAWFGES